MGICLTIFNRKEENVRTSQLHGTIFPSPFVDASLGSFLNRNDDKFYYIPNEDTIDKTIE
jgi:hypothetical protein